MDDTVKLIISIPKEIMEYVKNNGCLSVIYIDEVAKAFQNGIPLDSNSEKAELQTYFDGESFGWDEGREALIEELKAEIDEQYDRVHPYNIDVAQGLEMALEILDRIGKESEDT